MILSHIVAFLSGILVYLIGAKVADILAQRRERKRIIDERCFEIYMKLLILYIEYSGYTHAEINSEPVPNETRRKCFNIVWQIADLLRSADEIKFLDDILDVTLSSNFTTAQSRHDAMRQLLDSIGKQVNPRYTKKIHEISKMYKPTNKSNAPGDASSLF